MVGLRYERTIAPAELALRKARADYLRSWGWTETSDTPGSVWMWSHQNVPKLGRTTVSEETAIRLTRVWNGIEGQAFAHERDMD